MYKELALDVAATLRKWANDPSEVPDTYLGICSNLDSVYKKINAYALVGGDGDTLEGLAASWPKHSGKAIYPLVHFDTSRENTWLIPERLELCIYIAEQLEQKPELIEHFIERY